MEGARRQSFFTLMCSTCQGAYTFGFEASLIKVYLDTSGPLWLGLHSTAPSTGPDAPAVPCPWFKMSSGDSPLTISEGGKMGCLTYFTTTTVAEFRVWALGG